jgi:hypothetical protein
MPPAKTTRQQAEERRQEKLRLVQEQIETGELKVRQMTAEERRDQPPRPAKAKRPRQG